MNSVDPNKIKVSDLAKDAGGANLKIKKGFSVSLLFVMIIFTIGIFCLAIIPTCSIVFNAAQAAATDLSTRITNSIIINVYSDLSSIFSHIKTSIDSFITNESIHRVMTNVNGGIQLDVDANQAGKSFMNANDKTSTMACIIKTKPLLIA
ncbi:hypothetical protein HK096_003723 [Nowakowskiella sp. JEL0078]|nr:hypothetical protein HK096_003723 [Nowakowskiella sp. JEL0078]